jgi:aarF domain-containing kinase
VGRISEKVWNGLNDLLQSFITEDYSGIAKALVSIGATESSIDIESFGRELKEVVEKITKIQTNVVVEASSSGELIGANINIDERETTEIVLQIVSVADKNGLKLPREFGLLLKQALYFDRYQKLLAPTLDPLRDTRVRSSLSENDFRRNSINNKKESSTIIIDTEIIEK